MRCGRGRWVSPRPFPEQEKRARPGVGATPAGPLAAACLPRPASQWGMARRYGAEQKAPGEAAGTGSAPPTRAPPACGRKEPSALHRRRPQPLGVSLRHRLTWGPITYTVRSRPSGELYKRRTLEKEKFWSGKNRKRVREEKRKSTMKFRGKKTQNDPMSLSKKHLKISLRLQRTLLPYLSKCKKKGFSR